MTKNGGYADNTCLRIHILLLGLLALFSLSISPAHALTDKEILRGFNLTVFGAEYSPMGIQSHYIRKFNGVVRFKVHNLSSRNRRPQANQFINSLSRNISGLKTQIVGNPASANFNVYIVDRKDYRDVVLNKVYKRSFANVPGKCLVQSRFSRGGILRSDAVIVSDEGESLFKRCLIEEILQGLGPLNEHTSLSKSVFNDRSKHTRFTKFDRYILNILYDRRIRNGQSPRAVNKVLPDVLRDVRRRLR